MMKYDLWERARLNLRDYYFCIKSGIAQDAGTKLIFCNSFPKCGTHLMAEILRQFDGVRYWNDIVSTQSLSGVMNDFRSIKCKVATVPSGGLVRCHLSAEEKIKEMISERAAAHFMIYRDPRDAVISHANWVLKEPKFYLHDLYHRKPNSFSDCLMMSIKGITIGHELGSNLSYPDIGQNFSRWIGWLKDSDCMCIRFEDLVGERGGGNEEKRLAIVQEMHSKLKLTAPKNIADVFGSFSMDPSKSHTFRKGREGKKGQIGGWKDVFQSDHKNAFKQVAGDLLITLGYEKNNDW